VCVAERQGTVGGGGLTVGVPLDRARQGGCFGTGFVSGVAVVAVWREVKVGPGILDICGFFVVFFCSVCVWLHARGRWWRWLDASDTAG
jgi:hypothetical protein